MFTYLSLVYRVILFLDRFKIFFLYAERKFENVNWKHLTIFISVFINNVQNPPFLCSKKCLIFVYLSIYKTTSSNTYSHSSVHHSKKVWMMCKCVKHWHLLRRSMLLPNSCYFQGKSIASSTLNKLNIGQKRTFLNIDIWKVF